MLSLLSEKLDKIAGLLGTRVEEVQNERQLNDIQEITQSEKDMPVEDILPYAKLESGISAILAAFHSRQGVFSLDRAVELGDALVSFFKELASEGFLTSSTTYRSAYSHWCETSTKEDILRLRRSLKAAQGIVLSSNHTLLHEERRFTQLGLNHVFLTLTEFWSGKGKRTRRSGNFVGSIWNMRTYSIPIGELSVVLSEKFSERQSGGSHAPPETVNDLETRIRFTPRLENSRQGFETILRQHVKTGGTFNTVPMLLFNNILPFGSRVFILVREGRLSEFRKMLISGKASLRDQDEGGASLLQVPMMTPPTLFLAL